MDSNLQRIFGILVASIIFFLFPIYVAFEKRDDISYAIALKVTYNFVENVKAKGYLTRTMYDEYVRQLAASDNSYDISIGHTKKTYVPVFYVYNDNNVAKKFDFSLYNPNYNQTNGYLTVGGSVYGDDSNERVILSYEENEVKITDKQIFDVLNRVDTNQYLIYDSNLQPYKNITSIPSYPTIYGQNMYTMNVGDEFSVTIKNTNTTIAAVFFNLLTLGTQFGSSTPRVFVSYSGTISNEAYNTVL